MRTVPLGKTGIEVSALCFGTMYMGTKTDEETSRALLDQYLEAGGSFLDTANCYAAWRPEGSGGESEALLGRWMADRGNRDDLFLATKVGFDYEGIERGLDADRILSECDKSLRRLGTDRIDLYYAHWDDRTRPQAELVEAFDSLVKAGKVRFVAASNHRAWRLADGIAIAEAKGWAPYVAVQQRHTYLRPRKGHDFRLWPAANPDLLDCCRDKGLAILAYSPLLTGAYTRADKGIPDAYADEDTERRLAALREMAEAKGATANQVVLAWMLATDPQVIPLFSASTPEQLAEDLGALDIDLSPEDVETLDQAGV
jgi:aryl-alcohol dehydrogenase-like predicted oxidoreductase